MNHNFRTKFSNSGHIILSGTRKRKCAPYSKHHYTWLTCLIYLLDLEQCQDILGDFYLTNAWGTNGELIYAWKKDIFPRFSQPEFFPRFKPENLLLDTARFPGYNLGSKLTYFLGLFCQVQTWQNMQVSPANTTFQV